ncbi:MAG: polysaccharide pyruvyl transferase family protein [Turicibacter sp.]|nr:polysaccharide pyruvyl transferase family protein [Turicibacter sp.]
MERITVFDTSICSENVGDEIIMDCVYKQLRDIFKNTGFLKVPTHERISKISFLRMKKSKIGIVGGTNLLSMSMRYPINQWNIHLPQALKLKDTVLMGVGANNYSVKTDFYSKLVYKHALSKNYIHSVRDELTLRRMKELGITNVINTGCPTLWSLTKEFCETIPKKKAENVVCTFTDYGIDKEKDLYLTKILLENYKNVYCWIQGSNDYEYVKSLSDKFIFISPHLEDYDELLESNIELDFIGTRLHAGIRALQKGRRSIIISIDNRAREMGKDYSLPVLEREDISQLEQLIYSDFKTNIQINEKNINIWKQQFIDKE